MLDRFFLHFGNMLAFAGSLLSIAFLISAFAGLARNNAPFGDLAFAATVSIVTYCLAGTLHRIVRTPSTRSAD